MIYCDNFFILNINFYFLGSIPLLFPNLQVNSNVNSQNSFTIENDSPPLSPNSPSYDDSDNELNEEKLLSPIIQKSPIITEENEEITKLTSIHTNNDIISGSNNLSDNNHDILDSILQTTFSKTEFDKIQAEESNNSNAIEISDEIMEDIDESSTKNDRNNNQQIEMNNTDMDITIEDIVIEKSPVLDNNLNISKQPEIPDILMNIFSDNMSDDDDDSNIVLNSDQNIVPTFVNDPNVGNVENTLENQLLNNETVTKDLDLINLGEIIEFPLPEETKSPENNKNQENELETENNVLDITIEEENENDNKKIEKENSISPKISKNISPILKSPEISKNILKDINVEVNSEISDLIPSINQNQPSTIINIAVSNEELENQWSESSSSSSDFSSAAEDEEEDDPEPMDQDDQDDQDQDDNISTDYFREEDSRDKFRKDAELKALEDDLKRKAILDAEILAREEAKRKKLAEEERRNRLRAERQAFEENEKIRLQQLEMEMERKAREEAVRKFREEQERKAKRKEKENEKKAMEEQRRKKRKKMEKKSKGRSRNKIP